MAADIAGAARDQDRHDQLPQLLENSIGRP
jgi:hypothetical protein